MKDPASSYRYLALGDSYTIGEGAAPADRWPVQLAARLRAGGFDMHDPLIIARTGWTTADLLSEPALKSVSGPFDLVSLQIGVNDQYQSVPLARFQAQLNQLLAQARMFAGGRPERVIVVSIPDWSVTPFAEGRPLPRLRREIEAFNQAAASQAKALSAGFVNITPLSRQVGSDASLLAADGLHPSGIMYAQWVELVLPVAQIALAAQPPAH